MGKSPTKFRREYKSETSNKHDEKEEMILPAHEVVATPNIKGVEKGNEKKWLLIGFVIISLILVVLLVNTFIKPVDLSTDQKITNTDPIKFDNSIAVLPFSVLGDEVSEIMVAGIVEDILTNLTHFKNLKVISRTSSSRYKNTEISLKEVARELDVSYILEGSIRQLENRMIVTAQLIKAEEDIHVWAQNYEVKVEDIFKVQNEVVT